MARGKGGSGAPIWSVQLDTNQRPLCSIFVLSVPFHALRAAMAADTISNIPDTLFCM